MVQNISKQLSPSPPHNHNVCEKKMDRPSFSEPMAPTRVEVLCQHCQLRGKDDGRMAQNLFLAAGPVHRLSEVPTSILGYLENHV